MIRLLGIYFPLFTTWIFCQQTQAQKTTSQQQLPTTIVSNSTAEKGCYSFFDYGSGYRGKVSVTMSGRRCQNWNSQYPHVHSRTPENYQYMDLGKNYCRNPAGRNFDLGVWCYTTDPNKEWELCDVPQCERCFDPTNSGASYRGSVAHSKSCSTCQYWSSQSPHGHTRTSRNYPNSDLRRNYCRNPDGKEAPWCYTLTSTRWEYCPVEACPVACYDTFDSGATYRGKISQTETGIQCQEWSSQTPHVHGKTPHNYPRSGLTSNYCRNPDGSKRLWCYTTHPHVIWEYCDIPKCGETERTTQSSGNGWQKSRNRLYKPFKDDKMTYYQAESACRGYGGRLASEVLRNPVAASNIASQHVVGGDASWVGFDDIAEEGVWRWSDGGVKNNITTEWVTGEPNNWGGNEDCAEMYLSPDMNTLLINDITCNSYRAYICEI